MVEQKRYCPSRHNKPEHVVHTVLVRFVQGDTMSSLRAHVLHAVHVRSDVEEHVPAMYAPDGQD